MGKVSDFQGIIFIRFLHYSSNSESNLCENFVLYLCKIHFFRNWTKKLETPREDRSY